jgi:acetoacetyl-CoA reductase
LHQSRSTQLKACHDRQSLDGPETWYIATEMVMAVQKDVLEKSILLQIAVRRLGQPEEIARCVVSLAADDAGFVTGSTLSANGGQLMS